MSKSRHAVAAAVMLALAVPALAQTPAVPAAGSAQESAVPAQQQRAEDPAEQAYMRQIAALDWVKGPTTVQLAGNSELVVPEGFVFLDKKNTDKFLEINHNLAGGTEVLVAPANLHWTAYLSFADEGYVKDDEKIDAPKLLKTLQEGTEQANQERKRRGWGEMHVVDWALPPAYNTANKRLEWATLLESEGGRNVNFSTKVLGRRGHTSVVLAGDPAELTAARQELEKVLAGYSFKQGEKYADWVPGDKVAEYGLAALVLGGAAAIATKKGFWAILATFFAAAWKFVLAGVVALGAGIRRFFGKKADDSR
ncbi:MAG TPA: DUF2167 domain-containing protein [Steroidobacteraceae bacterium]|nr:DUF2167 domain-containing protein [Steroidobacteraceae bacterium]